MNKNQNYAKTSHMRKRKKWVLASTAILLAVTIGLTACGKSDAASAARVSDNTTRRVDAVVKTVGNTNEDQFRFPQAFGGEFEDARELRGTRRYGHRNRPDRYRAYLDGLDDLYIICAEISQTNAQIAARLEEIKHENAETKSLSKEMKRARKSRTVKQHREETFISIERKNQDAKRSLDKLYKERKSVSKQTRQLPRPSDNLNVETMTERYHIVLDKLQKRLELLTAVKTDLAQINNGMRAVLGQTVSHAQNPQTGDTPKRSTESPRRERPRNRPYSVPA